MKRIFFLLFTIFPFWLQAQDVNVTIKLYATEGGAHSFIQVSLVDTVTKVAYKGTTDANGEVTIAVPPNAIYDLLASNYTDRHLINVPNAPGMRMSTSLYYSRNMAAQDKAFAMSDEEKLLVDNFANALPDTTRFAGTTNPFKGASTTFYSRVQLALSDFDDGPLAGETVTLVGRKRHKAFKGVTDANGKLLLFLPKGDAYDLSFYYHKNFEYTEIKYFKGTSTAEWSFEYIGTVAYEKKKKEEAAQQAVEHSSEGVNGVEAVFDRNKFKNPLILCDVSKGMDMIMDDLQAWFAKNQATYPTAQFVFFNDGDKKTTAEKKVGETGGIYYTPTLPLDKLKVFMKSIEEKGNDSDQGDNYMEALIKGVQMAKQPYGDIVLLVDNHATVSDMSLLSQFKQPVHIIVFCSIKAGCIHSFIQPDYLKIAWKTKGTVHIDDRDYDNIGKMKDGDKISIGTGTFKLKGGEFFEM